MLSLEAETVGRPEDRAGFSDEVRLRLLEVDNDKADARLERHMAEVDHRIEKLTSRMEAGFAENTAAIKSVAATANKLLFALAVSAVGAAITVAVTAAGG